MLRNSRDGSGGDEFDVESGGGGEGGEVFGVRCVDLVAVAGEQDESGVDDVVGGCGGEENTGSAAECVVERYDLDAGEEAGDVALAAGSASPRR